MERSTEDLLERIDRDQFLRLNRFVECEVLASTGRRPSLWQRLLINLRLSKDVKTMWVSGDDPTVTLDTDYVDNADELDWYAKQSFITNFRCLINRLRERPTPHLRDLLSLLKWAEAIRTMPDPELESMSGQELHQHTVIDVWLKLDAIENAVADFRKAILTQSAEPVEGGLPC